MSAPKQDKGAVSTADRLEHYEAEAEKEISALSEQIAALKALLKPNADIDDEEQLSLGLQIDKLRRERDDAFDRWLKLSKQVREYYKSVASEKREGEKLLRADVEEYFQQFSASLDLAIESYIISLSQDACRAESPAQFYQIHAENLRSCKAAQIESAVRDGKLPKWALA
jgi:DNA-binding protein H-NS